MLEPMGVADKFFYYTSSGEEGSQNIWVSATLDAPINESALSEAFNEALKEYPEFAVRPVVKDNALFFQPHTASIPLTYTQEPLHFATSSTQGYPYLFRIEGNTVYFSFYHGISDVDGCWQFFMCMLSYYAHYMKNTELPIKRRITDETFSEREIDPYRYFANPQEEPSYLLDAPHQFVIPEKRNKTNTIITTMLSLPLSEVLSSAKAHNTSVAPFIMNAFFRALWNTYPVADEKIVGMVAANLRQFFETHTMRNFSDALFMTRDARTATQSFAEQASALRTEMKSQMNPAQFTRAFANRVQWIAEQEKSTTPIASLAQGYEAELIRDVHPPFTIGLSYPGKLEPPQHLHEVVIDTGFGGNTGLLFAAGFYSFKDVFRLGISQRFERMDLSDAIIDELKLTGLEIRDCNRKEASPDCLLVSKLETL